MRNIVHLSDLHFGACDATLLAPLLRRVRQLEPHLVVVSGDLTQRARAAQFREARQYLDQLPSPQIVVPGNHDIPLYNVFQRFFSPLDKYRRYINPDLEPAYIDDEIAVVGVNTARSLTFKRGRINEEQVQRVHAILDPIDERVTKIIVTHHPFDLPDSQSERDIVKRADMAMQMFADGGADILLAGHIHVTHTGDTSARYKIEGFAALVVQAGTAISTRHRGETNSFNFLCVESDAVRVDQYGWNPERQDYTVVNSETFDYTRDGWKEHSRS